MVRFQVEFFEGSKEVFQTGCGFSFVCVDVPGLGCSIEEKGGPPSLVIDRGIGEYEILLDTKHPGFYRRDRGVFSIKHGGFGWFGHRRVLSSRLVLLCRLYWLFWLFWLFRLF